MTALAIPLLSLPLAARDALARTLLSALTSPLRRSTILGHLNYQLK
jgi:hypothetical protein